MADPPATLESNPPQTETETPNPQPNQPDPAPASIPPQPQSSSFTPIAVHPNPNAPPLASAPPTPVSYAPPPAAPSFRPVPQFSPMPSPNYQNPSGVQVQPPGVSGGVPPMLPPHMVPYQVPPGQPPRPYPPHMPNGYPAVPAGTMPHHGIPRYPSPYTAMVRPPFPPRLPGAIGVLPAVSRPPIPGVPGVRPIMPPVVRPAFVPPVTLAEKPQTTVYVGKIASTVENNFMLSLLQLCGPVKSWKRAQDPTNGTPKGFGFCEFESAEGVLRALRLLSKLNIDGQELVLNVNQATKEYLERYVDKETEKSKKLKDAQAAVPVKEDESAEVVEKSEQLKPSVEDSNKEDNGTGNKESHDFANFGIVTDEDKEADQEALEKLTSMIEERLKTMPPPPPPPPPPAQVTGDGSVNSNSDVPAKSRDGDSEMRNAEDKNDDETTSETKPTSEHDRPETSSPDRSRRYDRRSRDRDRERDLKREKEREIERYERETERERVRKEREQRRKIEEAERLYEESLKEWEYREREKEKQRQYEKEREKERERKRKKEIKYDEEEDDDDSRRRWRRSMLEEKRKKRLREREDDLADGRKEEEEIAEAKRRAEEEQQQKQQRDALKVSSNHVVNGSAKTVLAAETFSVEIKDNAVEQGYEGDSARESHIGEEIVQNGTGEESTMASIGASDARHTGNAFAKKLGFGLVGSGKRTAVPSVFHEEDDDDARNEKKMRPLVPLDYSTEELEAVQPTIPGAPPPNLAAAAEFAKRISNVNPKDDKPDTDRERSRRSNDKSGQRDRDRDRDRGDEDVSRTRDENKARILDWERDREQGLDKLKTPDNKKLFSLKQLIDMIPKTKEELFSYEINWAVYDKHELHERMRPWISKKITEFLGEEETTLVDYIVSSTQDHVKASQMLELLQSILDDEAEMFVLKMWRMLIYEIKRVEAGLTSK
ncbi:LOW QUALITY PROTEIN: RNA-binding motif protein 25 [Corylus avellana]|uniref:LOW QUALITY PROTEIN: RNA-binding motif protein 25 n=1 Tax=Corylus avellana TaxID=13451 RepID=UPI00286C3D0F|nr:LOW QUALITY PROTEIN: RNA-binding motif protein 25 [Corylus avellana]